MTTPKKNSSVLAAVTKEIDAETYKARSAVSAEIEALARKMSQKSRPSPGVSVFVTIAAVGALLVAAAAGLTLTPLRRHVTPDHLHWTVRSAVFVIGSIAAAVPTVLRLTPRKSVPAQIYLVIAAAVAAALSVAFVTRPEEIVTSELVSSMGAGLGIAVLVCIIAMSVLSVVSDEHGSTNGCGLLGPFARLSSVAAVSVSATAYVFALIVAALNRGAKAESLDGPNPIFVVLASAAAIILVTEGLRRIVRRKDRRTLQAWKDSVDSSIDRCEVAQARVVMLAQLRSHWLATAAVAARIFRRPYGTGQQDRTSTPPPSAVRKMSVHSFRLSQGSQDSLVGSVTADLLPPGWLNQKYRYMADQFAESQMRRQGSSERSDYPPPEYDSYRTDSPGPPDSGPRREFLERVYNGEYDLQLKESADEIMADAMRAALSAEDVKMSSGPTSPDVPLESVIGELFPTGANTLPPGTLPPSTQAPPQCDSHIWLPPGTQLPSITKALVHESTMSASGPSVVLHGVRVDMSEPISVERLKPLPVPANSAPSGSATEPRPDPMM